MIHYSVDLYILMTFLKTIEWIFMTFDLICIIQEQFLKLCLGQSEWNLKLCSINIKQIT